MADDHSQCSHEEERKTDPSDPSIMNKYKVAGEIASNVLKTLISKCLPGSSVLELCQLGDNLIIEQTSKIFIKEKKLKKGIAFPTTISINNCICHFSPLASDASVVIEKEDVVKIDVSAHIDYCVASVATTISAGSTKEEPLAGKKADVIHAAYTASEIALRLLRSENNCQQVYEKICEVLSDFGCRSLEDFCVRDVSRDVLKEDDLISIYPSDPIRKDLTKLIFKQWGVYVLEIFATTSTDGKGKEKETRTTVFRRAGNSYNLKLKVSRDLYNQVSTKYGDSAFSLRSIDDEKKANLGIKECLTHQLVIPYPVFYDKPGEFVAHFKYTIIVGPKGAVKITTPIFMNDSIKSTLKLKNQDLIKLINEPILIKPKKVSEESIEKPKITV